MACDKNLKYSSEIQSQTVDTDYTYSVEATSQTDENRNVNNCNNKETLYQSSSIQTVQKVDASTMTEPLQIDFALTSEYLAHCSNSLGIPFVPKYAENSSSSSSSGQDSRVKMEYDLTPQNVNGLVFYSCPECAYKFGDRDALLEHLEEHRQRPYICDICGVCLKRKEHLDRHKQGHNTDRPFRCNVCCKSFKRNEHLARHLITHTGSKNQVCPECGKAFYRKDHLKKHLQSHSGSRNKSISGLQHSQPAQNLNEEGISNFALLMQQTKPPPFSILRT